MHGEYEYIYIYIYYWCISSTQRAGMFVEYVCLWIGFDLTLSRSQVRRSEDTQWRVCWRMSSNAIRPMSWRLVVLVWCGAVFAAETVCAAPAVQNPLVYPRKSRLVIFFVFTLLIHLTNLAVSQLHHFLSRRAGFPGHPGMLVFIPSTFDPAIASLSLVHTLRTHIQCRFDCVNYWFLCSTQVIFIHGFHNCITNCVLPTANTCNCSAGGSPGICFCKKMTFSW